MAINLTKTAVPVAPFAVPLPHDPRTNAVIMEEARAAVAAKRKNPKKPRGTLCVNLFGTGDGVLSGVSVYQTGRDRFTVTYGLQVTTDLDYGQAAAEFGECVFHALACNGQLDNREEGE